MDPRQMCVFHIFVSASTFLFLYIFYLVILLFLVQMPYVSLSFSVPYSINRSWNNEKDEILSSRRCLITFHPKLHARIIICRNTFYVGWFGAVRYVRYIPNHQTTSAFSHSLRIFAPTQFQLSTAVRTKMTECRMIQYPGNQWQWTKSFLLCGGDGIEGHRCWCHISS